MKNLVSSVLDASIQEVSAMLYPAKHLAEDDKKEILARYTAAFKPNFIAWMAGAEKACQSEYGRYACAENIVCEVSENHPGMIEDFVKPIECMPEKVHFEYIQEEVQSLWDILGNALKSKQGVVWVTMMWILEHTSAAFIPYIEEFALSLWETDTTYTQVHGEADIAHADQFSKAMFEESKFCNEQEAEKLMLLAKEKTLFLLKKVFQV